jgi:hypothetical protein
MWISKKICGDASEFSGFVKILYLLRSKSHQGRCQRTRDWLNDLTVEQKAGIERGLKNIEEGRIVSHSLSL